MNKNTKIIISVIAILVIIIAVTLTLNNEDLEVKKELNRSAAFILKENSQEIAKYTMDEISAMGETDFIATLDSSNTDPTAYTYTGVLLKTIFESSGISLEDKNSVTVTAADGYMVALDIQKVLNNNNVYLAYMREGEPLLSKEDGGNGPYQLVIRKDRFSQFWCKYALYADVK